MNIQRFILPASVAATLHVALLWFLPVEAYTPISGAIEVPLPPWAKQPEDTVTPPVEKSPDPEPVEKLPGRSARPELPDEIMPRRPDVPAIPVESLAPGRADKIAVVANDFGPGDGPLGPGGPGGPAIFAPDELDRVPSAKVQVAPAYPAALRHEGVTGRVVVEFEVDRAGQVSCARVVRSSRREFEAPTLRAVMKWRFEPGRRDGRTVSFRLTVPVEFTVED